MVSQHFLFQYERPIMSSASNTTMQLDYESQRKMFTTTKMNNGPHESRVQPALTASAPSQVCTHSHAPGKGWHHATPVQSKQCSHLLGTLSSQGLSCVPLQNQPCCDSRLPYMTEVCIMTLCHFGCPPLSAAFIFRDIKARKNM